jgi:hypothetical protein
MKMLLWLRRLTAKRNAAAMLEEAAGPERDDMPRKARQTETAAKINRWLTSPGLRPPT